MRLLIRTYTYLHKYTYTHIFMAINIRESMSVCMCVTNCVKRSGDCIVLQAALNSSVDWNERWLVGELMLLLIYNRNKITTTTTIICCTLFAVVFVVVVFLNNNNIFFLIFFFHSTFVQTVIDPQAVSLNRKITYLCLFNLLLQLFFLFLLYLQQQTLYFYLKFT